MDHSTKCKIWKIIIKNSRKILKMSFLRNKLILFRWRSLWFLKYQISHRKYIKMIRIYWKLRRLGLLVLHLRKMMTPLLLSRKTKENRQSKVKPNHDLIQTFVCHPTKNLKEYHKQVITTFWSPIKQ